MEAITENGGDWTPNLGENVRGCANPWASELQMRIQAYDHCGQCGDVPYRVLVIESENGKQRGVAFCGRHFVNACKECHGKTGCPLPRNERPDLFGITPS
jgi:hypothetical protein